jgi:hypothetical protein
VNKKGQGPIPSLNGTFPGSPKKGRANHMENEARGA